VKAAVEAVEREEAAMRFTDKVAIVTGGASGQGRETCRLFAAEGAHVLVADWNKVQAEALAKEIGGLAVQVDVSKEREVKAMIDVATQTFGRLDILINNAGVGFSESGRFPMASVVDTPEEAWDAILAINLKGVAMGCKHAIPVMSAQGRGAIVNIASINALVGVKGADAYTASKGGVVALTRILAVDWARKGIRVNCVCPGAVDTPMIRGVLEDQSIVDAINRRIPIGRVAQPNEIAHASLFLASEDASFINGAIIPVDGGQTAE
jgi:meso-butanediol dehydrogenase / (S,S)-butanediol dehydrogenase / diacetyl reductase